MLKNFFGKNNKSENKKPSDKLNESRSNLGPSEKTSQDASQEPPIAIQLEKAMIENARQDNQSNREKVFQELLFSELLLALTEQPNKIENSQEENPQNSINIAILANPQGMQFAAAFTSAAAAKRWRSDGGHYVAIRGQDIFKVVEPSPADVVVINPGSAPFVVLNKSDIQQLSLGLLPQTSQSPVFMSQGPAQNTHTTGDGHASGDVAGTQGANQDDGLQIAFPPDVFHQTQKQKIEEILFANANIIAVALGAILPPGAPKDNGWVRAIFLRTQNLPGAQDAMQKFCIGIREQLQKVGEGKLFADIPFEVGAMPDINFWAALRKNNMALFDKNPPEIPQ
ncbi:MAG: SseB family protein [Silvanigrellaceae bacterium]|nr:SseB family protein [Silvanigrellaceae bacterium]